jgi:hypothetical protein
VAKKPPDFGFDAQDYKNVKLVSLDIMNRPAVIESIFNNHNLLGRLSVLRWARQYKLVRSSVPMVLIPGNFYYAND